MSGILLSMCLPASLTFDFSLPKHLRGSPRMILAGGSEAVACVHAYACVCVFVFKPMYRIHYHLIIACISVYICLSLHALVCVYLSLCLCVCVCVRKWFKMKQRCSAEEKAQLVLIAQNTASITSSAIASKATCSRTASIRLTIEHIATAAQLCDVNWSRNTWWCPKTFLVWCAITGICFCTNTAREKGFTIVFLKDSINSCQVI